MPDQMPRNALLQWQKRDKKVRESGESGMVASAAGGAKAEIRVLSKGQFPGLGIKKIIVKVQCRMLQRRVYPSL